MNTGIRRKVDDLGRVVIPAGIRRSLSIREGDAVEVHVEGDQVILSKPTDRCVFCGEEEGLETFREKAVCRGCVAGVGVLDDSMRSARAPQPAAAEPSVRGTSDLPPWQLGERGANGRARGDAAGRDGEGSRTGDGDASGTGDGDPGQPPASTTAW